MGTVERWATGRIGTLGSALTFAGQATAALRAHRDNRAEPAYLPTMDAVAEAVLDGSIDAGVLTSETSRTACTDTAARILGGEPLFVLDEIVVPYHCALLVKPGTLLGDIRHVGGHGSLRQCGEFLRSHLPHATSAMHQLNSVAAAREVFEGDGSTAVIATEALASELGLQVLARDVDGGAVGAWWALGAALETPPGADHVAVRIVGSAALNDTLRVLATHELVIRTVTNAPTGEVFQYRYLVTAHTSDGSSVPAAVVADLGAAVVGVFASTTVD